MFGLHLDHEVQPVSLSSTISEKLRKKTQKSLRKVEAIAK